MLPTRYSLGVHRLSNFACFLGRDRAQQRAVDAAAVHLGDLRQPIAGAAGLQLLLEIRRGGGAQHDLVAELEERLAHLDDQLEHPIAIHLNGCPNSCARIQVADIGLKGQIITDAAGDQVPGYQVHLGGGLGEDLVVGRKLRAHKVAASELGDYVERVVTRYIAARESGESFGDWARRADEEELR